eukprot:248680_1
MNCMVSNNIEDKPSQPQETKDIDMMDMQYNTNTEDDPDVEFEDNSDQDVERYSKIFGKELKNECTHENVLWFWKRLYLRDFGVLIFRQERLQHKSQKRHLKSVSQQAKQFAWNKKHSADFWMQHYLSEYSGM